MLTTGIIVWIVLAVLFFVVEAATIGLISLWFGIGSLAALIAATMNASVQTQLIVFVVVSIISLILTRPFLKKAVRIKKVSTNSDLNVGKLCTVIQDISPDMTGRVRLDGVDWAARSEHWLKAGDLCVVCAVESATLLVQPQKSQPNQHEPELLYAQN